MYAIVKRIQSYFAGSQYIYLRYWSEKDQKIVERIAFGEPTERISKTGSVSYLYNDVLKHGVRSFKPENLCEQRRLNFKQAMHYIQQLAS